MGNLYLVDKPYGANGLGLALRDQEGIVVLIQDGVYLDVDELIGAGRTVYALQRDIERRGLQQRLPGRAKAISFEELVDLIVDNKVINFA